MGRRHGKGLRGAAGVRGTHGAAGLPAAAPARAGAGEPAELARLAAAHPFFLRALLALPDFDTWNGAPGCKICKSRRKVLFLRRKKLLWCPRCEGAKLAALVEGFERLVEQKRQKRAGVR